MGSHTHQRSMLSQPKTIWKCECSCDVFNVLLCPECLGTEQSHIVGFQCVACETIHVTPSGADVWQESENEVH